jgi:hypothetical protein
MFHLSAILAHTFSLRLFDQKKSALCSHIIHLAPPPNSAMPSRGGKRPAGGGGGGGVDSSPSTALQQTKQPMCRVCEKPQMGIVTLTSKQTRVCTSCMRCSQVTLPDGSKARFCYAHRQVRPLPPLASLCGFAFGRDRTRRALTRLARLYLPPTPPPLNRTKETSHVRHAQTPPHKTNPLTPPPSRAPPTSLVDTT